MAGTNNFGPFYNNTGTINPEPPPLTYGAPGVSQNNLWGLPVSGVDSPFNQNIPESVPSAPPGGINNNVVDFAASRNL